MSSYNVYVFFLCLFVFTLLTLLFSVMLVIMVKNYLKLVKHGLEDENIITEFEKMKMVSKVRNRVLGCIFSIVVFAATAVVFAVFIFSVVVGVRTTKKVGSIPALKVVVSDSMASKHPSSKYLFENDLNDQLRTFDLILLHQLPAEKDLKQYDIVAYELDGKLVLHRIVNIEEPNEKHPNERYFLLQGDAVGYHDKFPVLYRDMRGIYRGERVAFAGSFFMFMQSPAGYLCILLILIALVATPLTERKIKKEKNKRYQLICAAAHKEEPELISVDE